MDDFLTLQLLGRRQDASSGSTGNGGSKAFLDLIANPFVAAVSFKVSLLYWAYHFMSDLFSSKKVPSGRRLVLPLVPLPFSHSSSHSSVLDIPSSMLRRSSMPTPSMRLLQSRKVSSHG